jgi:hypothetical protein
MRVVPSPQPRFGDRVSSSPESPQFAPVRRGLERIDRTSEWLNRHVREYEDALRRLHRECGEANWDACGADPVQPETLTMALEFAQALPASFALADVSADPDGDIDFEWYRDKDACFSVSVSAAGVLTYAGIVRGRRAAGTEDLTDPLPDVIVSNLRSLGVGK